MVAAKRAGLDGATGRVRRRAGGAAATAPGRGPAGFFFTIRFFIIKII
jgi:hypothetical protein